MFGIQATELNWTLLLVVLTFFGLHQRVALASSSSLVVPVVKPYNERALASSSSLVVPVVKPYNESTSPINYGVRLTYSGSTCSTKSSVLMEEHLRVGDPNICFRYDASWEDARSFRLYRAVDAVNGNLTYIVTHNYHDSTCSTFQSRRFLPADACQPDLENQGSSFRISWVQGSTPPAFKSSIVGYTLSMYMAADESCVSARVDSPTVVMRRTFSPNRCFEQPNAQSFLYSCKPMLTEHWDKFYTVTNSVQECDASGQALDATAFISKTYLPPPQCQAVRAAPGGGLSYNYFTPQNATLGKASVLFASGWHQSLSCPVPRSGLILSMFKDMLYTWAIRSIISFISVLSSIATIAIIFKMKKWTEATRIIFCLSVAQLCYDVAFFTPYPHKSIVATEASFILSKRISAYLVRVFSLCTLLISNLLGLTVVYIVVFSRQFKVKNLLGPIVAGIVLLAVGLPLPTLLSELESVEGLSIGANSLSNPMAGLNKPAIIGIFLTGLVQISSVFFNIIAFLTVTLATLNSKKKRDCASFCSPPDKNAKVDPIQEVSKRLALYPIIQSCTQLSGIWYIYDAFLKPVSDDTYATLHFRLFEYVNAIISPIAGLLFFCVFVMYHPGAKTTLYSALRGCLRCQFRSREDMLALVLRDTGSSMDKEKASALSDLVEQGVSPEDAESVYLERKECEKLRAERPDLTDEQLQIMVKKARSSLGTFLGANSNGKGEAEAEGGGPEWTTNQNSSSKRGGWSGGGGDNETSAVSGRKGRLDNSFFQTGVDGDVVGVRALTAAEMSQVDDDTLAELIFADRRIKAVFGTGEDVAGGLMDSVKNIFSGKEHRPSVFPMHSSYGRNSTKEGVSMDDMSRNPLAPEPPVRPPPSPAQPQYQPGPPSRLNPNIDVSDNPNPPPQPPAPWAASSNPPSSPPPPPPRGVVPPPPRPPAPRPPPPRG